MPAFDLDSFLSKRQIHDCHEIMRIVLLFICFCSNVALEILISATLHKNVFEESYLVPTKSPVINRLSLGDRPIAIDFLVTAALHSTTKR